MLQNDANTQHFSILNAFFRNGGAQYFALKAVVLLNTFFMNSIAQCFPQEGCLFC